MLTYPVILDPAEEGGFVVTFPNVPEAITQGDNETEALMMAQDALVTMFDAYMQDRQTIPEGSSIYAKPCVIFPVILAGKIALYNAMLTVNMTTEELAMRLDIAPAMAERLLSLRHKSRIEQIENGLALFGKRLVVDVREAA